MRKVISILMLALLALGIAPVLAQDTTEEELPNLLEVIAGQENLTSLAAAVEALGLAEAVSDPDVYWTVFAPTDEAFAALLEATGNADLGALVTALTPETTIQVVSAHLVPGYITSTTVLALDEANEEAYTVATGLAGYTLSVQDAMLNETIGLVTVDLLASNGVVHVIDTVIVPSAEQLTAANEITAASVEIAEAAMTEANIAEVATGAGSFTTLLAAAEAAGLVEALTEGGPYTVFAPTDEAFAAALEALGVTAADLLADPETLASILLYHIVPGTGYSPAVVALNGAFLGTMLEDTAVQITVDDMGAQVNGVAIVAVDVAASNGVIHVIDGVLLPPAGEEE
ncbi:MAG: fasciclin domain-containing protein [Anaerolineae bacterium]|nr:fasciclin domain-containing protein [Anaerolineae bacterium]